MAHTTGVLLINLGTPQSPLPSDVRRYLIEFLTDGRVIDEPWLKRQLLVRGVIVPSRYKLSAASYQAIWTPEGSPLMVYGRNVQRLLQANLGDDFYVELAMRYQQPSLQQGIDALMQKGVSRLVVLPLFPQYASATTGSVHQRVMEILSKQIVIPQTTFIDSYPDHPRMIDAFCALGTAKNWQSYDHLLFSFHGLPQRQLLPGSRYCYAAQCEQTADALARRLGVSADKYTVCYQSRLGKQPWIQPYTSDIIKECVKKKRKKILVFCPSFVCDCLETIYEIGVEYAHEFKSMGGESLDLVEGLNEHPLWIKALQELVVREG
jgi:ferrochelatase